MPFQLLLRQSPQLILSPLVFCPPVPFRIVLAKRLEELPCFPDRVWARGAEQCST